MIDDATMRELRTAADMAGLSQEFAELCAEFAAERDETFRLQCSHSLLYARVEELRADAEHWRRIDSDGRYWLENRSGIIDCLTRNGYELLSSSSGWTLHKLPAARAARGSKP